MLKSSIYNQKSGGVFYPPPNKLFIFKIKLYPLQEIHARSAPLLLLGEKQHKFSANFTDIVIYMSLLVISCLFSYKEALQSSILSITIVAIVSIISQ